MMKAKLNNTLSLLSNYRSTRNIKILDKVIKLSTEICTSPLYMEDDKIVVLKELLSQAALEEEIEKDRSKNNSLNKKIELEPDIRSVNIKNLCNDYICRWRDSLCYLKGTEIDTVISLLRRVVKLQELSVEDRVYTAVYFYNTKQYHVCYPCFTDLANDKDLPLKYRLEAAKFLFSSGEDEERDIARDVLLSIIQTQKYECKERYDAIRSYIPNKGIRTISNIKKLKVPYEEEFVYVLQQAFFFNEENDYRYRILSGQHLLQMECVENDMKRKIVAILFSIGSNINYTENGRADALDVILRLGNKEEQTHAKLELSNIGKSSSKETFKTLYNNSQNIHNDTISDSIREYLERSVEKPAKYKNFTWDETLNGLTEYIREFLPLNDEKSDDSNISKKRFAINSSLLRIQIDTATFTKYGITSMEVLRHVWSRINSGEFDENTVKLLKERLVDEFLDMDDTCSSGGSGRLVNVFSGFDDTIKISWEDQLTANVKGRIDARVRGCKDLELQATLTFGMMEDADEEDRKVYLKFVLDNIGDVEEELRKEFVGEGHLSENEFSKYMQNIKKNIS